MFMLKNNYSVLGMSNNKESFLNLKKRLELIMINRLQSTFKGLQIIFLEEFEG